MMANSDHPAIVAMQRDLEAMPESDRSTPVRITGSVETTRE